MLNCSLFIISPFNSSFKDDEYTDEFCGWIRYVEKTYIGIVYRGRRQAPHIQPVRWSQFKTVLEGRMITTNGAEGFNSAFAGNKHAVLNL